jgi:hypothetical protein
VRYKAGDVLRREGKHTGTGKRVWTKYRTNPPVGYYGDTERIGYVVGQRTLSNGEYERGWSSQDVWGEWDGDSSTYTPTETFQAYLVVDSLWGSPVKIRVEDVVEDIT